MAEEGEKVSVLLDPRVVLVRSVSLAAAFVLVDFGRCTLLLRRYLDQRRQSIPS